MSANGHRPPSGNPPAEPEDVRGVLRELRDDASPDEREFAAGLHRRLVAAGAPVAATWLRRLASGARDLWQDLRGDLRQRRSLFTGAVLGALVTAVVLTLLSGPQGNREALREPAPESQTVGVAEPPRPVLRPSNTEHKTRTAGDRPLTRDRIGSDIGAERAERSRTRDKR